MKILIVDDKYDVVQGIKDGVEWAELGDITLYEAYSGMEALKIVRANHVDLIITDIEMPGLSGIDMAKQAVAEFPDIGIVFLSSFDSFRFAQAAIRLGCYDYILQPVDYKTLQTSIGKVLEQMGSRKKNRLSDTKTQRDTEATARKNKDDVWKNIILRPTEKGNGEMQKILESAGIDGSLSELYRIIFIELREKAAKAASAGESEKKRYIAEVKTAIEQALPLECWIPLINDCWIALLKGCEAFPPLQSLITLEDPRANCQLAVYVSGKVKLSDLHDSYMKLLQLRRNNIVGYSGIYGCPGESGKADLYNQRPSGGLSTSHWRNWLLEGKEECIFEDVERYLEEKEKQRSLDRKTLIRIVQLVSNTFYNFDDEITRKIMSSEEILNLYSAATDSKDAMKKYLKKVIELHKACKIEYEKDAGQVLVRKIKSYIAAHISERLSREEISGVFFISKDYVSQLFRKYENMGFTQYVNVSKMEKAKELLAKTGLPVRVIASSVGVQEYSYFSKMFKDYSGMSANEFRASVRKNSSL